MVNDTISSSVEREVDSRVTVTVQTGKLSEFVLPSVTQLPLTGLPGGVGNKGNRVSRKRKREEINDRVALSTVHKSQDRPAATLTNQPVTSCTATAADLSNQVMPGPCPTYQYAPQLYPPLPHPMSMQFNTGLGDISVQSPTQWSALNLPSYTHTATSETEFRLCLRRGNISVCNGCRNKFDKKAKALYDLCVQHEEWRPYVSPTTNLSESIFGNAYYHTNPACIIIKWPSFHPQSLVISPDDHKSFLSSVFGIYINF